MKTITALMLLVSITTISFSQDTLFFEDFNAWNYIEIEDSIFKDYDEDGLPDANTLPGGWFVGNFGNGGTDTNEVVALSSSWLTGFMPGNRNWLMLPGIDLADTTATLSWKSAPAVGNLYMDGYSVLISDNEYLYYDINLADTLMHFAQNINDDETQFSTGTKHTLLDLSAPINVTPVTQYPGLLMPWSVDLSPWAGKTVYIAFLHNSDDDNFLALDDILVTGKQDTSGGTGSVTIEEASSNNDLYIYPSITKDFVTIRFTNNLNKECYMRTLNLAGQEISRSYFTGNQPHQISLQGLENGIYFIQVATGEHIYTRKVVKQ